MYRWLLALSFVAVSAQAQTTAGSAGGSGADGTIDPGMTRAQVIEKLGKPATIRNYQGSTYLMYSNKCGKTCGMQDIVILDHDVVVDAVFRSPERHYSGTSTSPEATKANSRTQRNQSLAVPAPSAGKAEVVAPSMTHTPADSTKTSTSHPPADSATSSMSRPPADTVPLPVAPPSTQPTSAPPSTAPTTTAAPTSTAASQQAPYGKPPTAAPPADSTASTMSHPPVDNSASSTAHPPKPPK